MNGIFMVNIYILQWLTEDRGKPIEKGTSLLHTGG